MGSLIFDTTFLIDFQREKKRGAGNAHHFFFANKENPAFVSVISLGEFGEGFSSLADATFLSVIAAFQILPILGAVSSTYAKLSRRLRYEGKLIQTNDLWIAAIALESGFPLVTRNLVHFSRIPGLELRSY